MKPLLMFIAGVILLAAALYVMTLPDSPQVSFGCGFFACTGSAFITYAAQQTTK